MLRKESLLKGDILENLDSEKKLKEVIETLTEPEDFLNVLAVLDGKDKNISETADSYEALLRRFKIISPLINCYTAKEEWHAWTVALLELSNVLWKSRDKFDQSLWLEANKKIYEIMFKVLKSFDSDKRDHKECKHCSRLFSNMLSNLIYAKENDINDLHLPPLDKIKEVCEKNVGLNWYYLTCGPIIEEKVGDF